MRGSGGEEKPPVLRIKKDAQVLDEGLPPMEPRIPAGAVPQGRPGRRGPRRPGRFGRFSTVIALALAGLAMLFILRAQPRVSNRATMAGCKVELRAAAVGDWLTASITIVDPQSGTGAQSAAGALVRFSLPDTGQEAVAVGQLSGVTILSARLPIRGAETRIVASVRIGGQVRELTLGLRGRRGKP
jgi:hypothetical protein